MSTLLKFLLAVNLHILSLAAYLTDSPIKNEHWRWIYHHRRKQNSALQSIDFSSFFPPVERYHRFALNMASTPKSGGRPILSMEDFQKQVLSSDSVTLKESKDARRPILVYFTAPWCGPCRLTVPIIKEIINQFQSMIDIVDVCTDDLPEVAENAGVVSIPTIQIYYDGELMDTIVGCVSTKVLASAVTKILEDVGLKE
jgi:thioredoxin 1